MTVMEAKKATHHSSARRCGRASMRAWCVHALGSERERVSSRRAGWVGLNCSIISRIRAFISSMRLHCASVSYSCRILSRSSGSAALSASKSSKTFCRASVSCKSAAGKACGRFAARQGCSLAPTAAWRLAAWGPAHATCDPATSRPANRPDRRLHLHRATSCRGAASRAAAAQRHAWEQGRQSEEGAGLAGGQAHNGGGEGGGGAWGDYNCKARRGMLGALHTWGRAGLPVPWRRVLWLG